MDTASEPRPDSQQADREAARLEARAAFERSPQLGLLDEGQYFAASIWFHKGYGAARAAGRAELEGVPAKCIFCGLEFMPPAHPDALKLHVTLCPKHPMRELEGALRKARKNIRSAAAISTEPEVRRILDTLAHALLPLPAEGPEASEGDEGG